MPSHWEHRAPSAAAPLGQTLSLHTVARAAASGCFYKMCASPQAGMMLLLFSTLAATGCRTAPVAGLQLLILFPRRAASLHWRRSGLEPLLPDAELRRQQRLVIGQHGRRRCPAKPRVVHQPACPQPGHHPPPPPTVTLGVQDRVRVRLLDRTQTSALLLCGCAHCFCQNR